MVVLSPKSLRFRPAAFLGLICLVIAACATVPIQKVPGSAARVLEKRVLKHRGIERYYLILGLKEKRPGAVAPVVIICHGSLTTPEDVWTHTSLPSLAEEHGFILIAPNGDRKLWEPDVEKRDDVGFISDIIDHVIAQDGGDPQRIYVTGISGGAGMTYALATAIGDRLAAVAPVAAPMAEIRTQTIKTKKPLSLMLIMGTKDPLVPYEGGNPFKIPTLSSQATLAFWAQHNGCTGLIRTTALPDVDPHDKTTISLETQEGCRDGSEVRLYSVIGGGHNWPKGFDSFLTRLIVGRTSYDMDAGQEIWSFFQRHSRSFDR